MCGKETAGFEAAECGLYRNATWVLSPLARTAPESVALAAELVTAVEARPVVLEAARHDRLVASISHLPYLLASALTAAVAEVGVDDPQIWELAAGGFRDTSRVAASATNRPAVLAAIDRFDRHLDQLRSLVERSAEPELRQHLAASRQARSRWKPRQ
jgi:prephenate dehydrogenase